MSDSSRTRTWAAAILAVLVVAVVAVVLAFPPAGPAATSTVWEVGGGLATMSAQQQVGGRASWETYCPPTSGACMDPAGVTYVPSAQLAVVTEDAAPQFFGGGGINAFIEFDPATGSGSEAVRLNCTPGIPYYPGVGINVLVPCWNGTYTLLAIDVQSARVAASVAVSIPNAGSTSSMAYDPTDGLVYWGAEPSTIVVYDPVNNSVVATTSMPEASFLGGGTGNDYQLAWDPDSHQLVMPSAAGGLIGVDPTTGDVVANVSLPAPAWAIAVDLTTNQLFVSSSNTTTSTSRVLVFNAASYTLEKTLTIPNCFENNCALPNEVNQILFDPAYGDAYFVSTMAFISVNLTTLGIVSALLDYGNGPQLSSVLVPGLDLVFSTYEPQFVGPGVVVAISHGSQSYLTGLLWLPMGLVELALAGVVGVVLAVFRPGYIPPEELEAFHPPLDPVNPPQSVTRVDGDFWRNR